MICKLLKEGGDIPNSNYIIIGDFVDATIQWRLCNICFAQKCILLQNLVKYLGNLILLREYHESRQSTQVYGFYEEILRKYGNSSPSRLFMDVFDCLPLAAIMEGSILCVHGGLSPEIRSIEQIRTIDRKMEIPIDSAFCDLQWSDPDDIQHWAVNPKGAGYLFGDKFTKEFALLMIQRQFVGLHQLVMEGHKYWFSDQNLVTIWSAPNQCQRCGNLASQLRRAFLQMIYLQLQSPNSKNKQSYEKFDCISR